MKAENKVKNKQTIRVNDIDLIYDTTMYVCPSFKSRSDLCFFKVV